LTISLIYARISGYEYLPDFNFNVFGQRLDEFLHLLRLPDLGDKTPRQFVAFADDFRPLRSQLAPTILTL